MGKRGPKKRFTRSLTFRPDEETIEALAADLQALRAVRPRASTADVLRSWARSSNRERFVSHEAQLQVELAGARAAVKVLEARLQAADDLVAGYEDRAHRDQVRDLEVALRSLDTNPQLVHHVQDLVKLEASGLVATSSYPLLQRARRGVPSWQDLLQRRDAP